MESKKGKIGKTVLKVGTGIVVFAGALIGTYSLVPNKVNIIDLTPANIGGEDVDESQFSKFVAKVTKDLGIAESEEEEERVYSGLQAEFDDLVIKYRTDDELAFNTIKVDGNLDFMMRGLKLSQMAFNLNANVTYNEVEIPLELGYTNSTIYFGLKDLRMKASHAFTDEDEFLETVAYYFGTANEGGLDLNLGKMIDDLVDPLFDIESLLGGEGGLDINSLLAGSEDGTGFSMGTPTEEQDPSSKDWTFTLELAINEKDETTQEIISKPINVVIRTDEELTLKRVDVAANLGNVTINGGIDLSVVPNLEVLAPTDPLSPAYNENYTYVEVVSYSGWIKKLANLLSEDNQKFGFSFALDLDKRTENSETKGFDINDIGKIEGSINADFSELIDLSAYKNEVSKAIKRNETPEEKESLLEKVLNKVSLGLELKLIGSDDVTEYGNLSIIYDEGAGYINLNETSIDDSTKKSVAKAKIDTETFNWLMDEVPGMFSSLSGESESSNDESLFSFLTDSKVVNGIKNGDYSAIVGMITNLSNDSSKINLDISLSDLGLGDNATVNLVLDSSEDPSDKVLSLDVSDVQFGTFLLNVAMENDEYTEMEVGDKENYDSLNFVTGVFDQVSGILNSKQVGFTVEGSVLDKDSLGIKFSGQGQLDYGRKFGFGDLDLEQYKYNSVSPWYTHHIALDVDNQTEDFMENNVRMIYGERGQGKKNIKANLTIASIKDIINVVKEFVGDMEDDRFSKFLEPLNSQLGLGTIVDTIKSGDYLRLVKNDILKEMRQSNGGNTLNIVIGGDFIGMGADLEIQINFKTVDNLKKIDSILIPNITMGEGEEAKTIRVRLGLVDYDANRESPCNHSWSYMSLDSVATLLQLGINTTQLGYYKLQASASVSALAIINFDVNIQMHIVVDGKTVKIYALLPDTKLTTFGSIQENVGVRTTSMKSELTFQTYAANDPNKTNDIGGYFHIKRTQEVGWTSWFKETNIYHYKTTSKNFLDNILDYLLVDLLDIKKSLINLIGDLDLSGSEEKEPGDFTNLFTDTGFQYTASSKTWNTGINIGELVGIEALNSVELTITGKSVSGTDYLHKLKATLNVQASLVTVKVVLDAELKDIDPNATDWSSSIQSAFDNIVSVNCDSVLNNKNGYVTK